MLEWIHQSWITLKSQPELITKAWNKCLKEELQIDPFDVTVQKAGTLECIEQKLKANNFTFDKDDSEAEKSDVESDMSDNEKGEFDLMKKITFGERRSSRKKPEQRKKIGYFLDSSAIEFD